MEVATIASVVKAKKLHHVMATQELKNSIQTKLEQSGEYDRSAPPATAGRQRLSIPAHACAPTPGCRIHRSHAGSRSTCGRS